MYYKMHFVLAVLWSAKQFEWKALNVIKDEEIIKNPNKLGFYIMIKILSHLIHEIKSHIPFECVNSFCHKF